MWAVGDLTKALENAAERMTDNFLEQAALGTDDEFATENPAQVNTPAPGETILAAPTVNPMAMTQPPMAPRLERAIADSSKSSKSMTHQQHAQHEAGTTGSVGDDGPGAPAGASQNPQDAAVQEHQDQQGVMGGHEGQAASAHLTPSTEEMQLTSLQDALTTAAQTLAHEREEHIIYRSDTSQRLKVMQARMDDAIEAERMAKAEHDALLEEVATERERLKQAWESIEEGAVQIEELKSALEVSEQLGVAKAAEHAQKLREVSEGFEQERTTWMAEKEALKAEAASALQKVQKDEAIQKSTLQSVQPLQDTVSLLEGRLEEQQRLVQSSRMALRIAEEKNRALKHQLESQAPHLKEDRVSMPPSASMAGANRQTQHSVCSFRRFVICYVIVLHVVTALLLFLEDEECTRPRNEHLPAVGTLCR